MNWLELIDVRVKLAVLFVYLVFAFHADKAWALGVCVGLAVVFACVTHMSTREGIRMLQPLFPIIIITTIMQVLYLQKGTPLVYVASICVTQEALISSARLVVCLVCVLVASAAFMRCTQTDAIVVAIMWGLSPFERLGLRVRPFALSLSVALSFIPILVADFRQLRCAHMVRGVNFQAPGIRARLHAYRRLFAPLLKGAFTRADTLAYALVSRCFRA